MSVVARASVAYLAFAAACSIAPWPASATGSDEAVLASRLPGQAEAAAWEAYLDAGAQALARGDHSEAERMFLTALAKTERLIAKVRGGG